MQQPTPSYTLTLKQLLNRPNYVVISEAGMKYRTEIKEDTQSASPIPKKISQKTLKTEKSKELQCFRIGTSSFYQSRSNKESILQTINQTIKVQKPYEKQVVQKLIHRVMRADTPNIINKLNESEKDIKKLDESIKETTMTVIEQKINKLHENYQLQLKKRESTQKHIQLMLQQQKLYNQRQNELYDCNFQRPRNQEIVEEFYKDPKYEERKSMRLKEYQQQKFEKFWKLQPILNKQ